MMTAVLIMHDKLHSSSIQTKHTNRFSTLDLGIRIKKPEQVYMKWSEKMNTISQLSTSV